MMPPNGWQSVAEPPQRSDELNVNTRAGQASDMCSYLELGALLTAVPCARLHIRHLLWSGA